ncbi:hypothetical protein Bca52824_069960 [Brassica carinata]|uniref:Uncharacterized protein n=1 Tax=Brassica carinata TaxID=52824 RepID=A0A8X7U4M5_BRACI|nr:hypothetical protein Bca52824_069960 [Brassica carinata]
MAAFEESSDLDAIQEHLLEDFLVADGFMGDFDFNASFVSGLWCIEPVMNQVPKQEPDSPVLDPDSFVREFYKWKLNHLQSRIHHHMRLIRVSHPGKKQRG